MSEQRTITMPKGQWAENAQTTIPFPPEAGTPYRTPDVNLSVWKSGQPFNSIVDSAQWNQMLYLITGMLSAVEKTGILTWSPFTDYPTDAVAMGTDGVLYRALAQSGPNSGGEHQPPDTARWAKLIPDAPAFSQVNADWNAVSGPAEILNKPDLSGSGAAGPFLGRGLITPASGTLQPGSYVAEIKGGGGGGGRGAWTGDDPETGGGGGEAETVYWRFTLTEAAQYSFTVGMGGAGAPASGSDDQAGSAGLQSSLTVGAITKNAAGGAGGSFHPPGSSTQKGTGGGSDMTSASEIRIKGASGNLTNKSGDDDIWFAGGRGGGAYGGRGSSRDLTGEAGRLGCGGGGGANENNYAGLAGGQGYVRLWLI